MRYDIKTNWNWVPVPICLVSGFIDLEEALESQINCF